MVWTVSLRQYIFCQDEYPKLFLATVGNNTNLICVAALKSLKFRFVLKAALFSLWDVTVVTDFPKHKTSMLQFCWFQSPKDAWKLHCIYLHNGVAKTSKWLFVSTEITQFFKCCVVQMTFERVFRVNSRVVLGMAVATLDICTVYLRCGLSCGSWDF